MLLPLRLSESRDTGSRPFNVILTDFKWVFMLMSTPAQHQLVSTEHVVMLPHCTHTHLLQCHAPLCHSWVQWWQSHGSVSWETCSEGDKTTTFSLCVKSTATEHLLQSHSIFKLTSLASFWAMETDLQWMEKCRRAQRLRAGYPWAHAIRNAITQAHHFLLPRATTRVSLHEVYESIRVSHSNQEYTPSWRTCHGLWAKRLSRTSAMPRTQYQWRLYQKWTTQQ